MTEKERAKELVTKFERITAKIGETSHGQTYYAKQCAIIAVDEILHYEAMLVEEIGADSSGYTPKYWKQVKEELNKL